MASNYDNKVTSIADINMKDLLYKPQTAATYALITKCISKQIGFQHHDILESLADDVIKIIKHPNKDDYSRRTEVDECLGGKSLDDDAYHDLYDLCRNIPDPDKTVVTKESRQDTDEQVPINFDDDEDALSDEYMPEINEEENDIDFDDNELDEIFDRNEENLRAQDERLMNLDELAKRQANDALSKNFGEPIHNDGYIEFHIEPKKRPPLRSDLIKISELPEHEAKAFSGIKELNYIQSRIYKKAMTTDSSLLICAPTGSGKTNIAMLAMLREINKSRLKDGSFDLHSFKIIYIAPIKALVQELVTNLRKRLSIEPYNIVVEELTGDHQLNQREILDAQIIVCTPEKWDIVTRKSLDRIYIKLVRLVIFDEIHLLHNERGATLEALISRIKRHKQMEGEPIRIVGLSATLPNYKDVARFIAPNERVEDSTFYFDDSYRPIPLRQEYVAMIDSKQVFKKINDILYNKVIDRLAGDSQVLVFVHSRPDTRKTADFLKTKAYDEGKIDLFLTSQSNKHLEDELEDCRASIQELIKFGIGIHHAGLSSTERHVIEELFRRRQLKVLVSTATLAWGVNLPARTVIIKGTQVYRDGRWTELDSLDVTQMLGRAGRPGYDSKGEGIVITQQSQVYFYMSLMTEQLPVESRLIGRLPEFINAECVIGSIQSLEDSIKWISETYLSSRMMSLLENRADELYMRLYGFTTDAIRLDPKLLMHRKNLAYTAASILDNRGLIIFDRVSGTIQSTELGRIASHFNCSSRTIKLFYDSIYEQMSDIELMRTFSLSEEFKDIFVRRGEELDLKALIDRLPFPIDSKRATSGANKVNALLQVYIFKIDLQGSELVSDLHFIINNAARLARAIHEIVLLKKFAQVAELSFDLCRKIDKRMTVCHTPLRQFQDDLDVDTLNKLERKNYIINELRLLKPEKITELLRCDKREGDRVYKLLEYLPRYKLEASVKPVSRRCIRIDLTTSPDFKWNEKYHGYSQRLWLLVEDVNQDTILHHEVIHIKKHNDMIQTSFFVPYLLPVQPFYYIRTLADGWFGCDQLIPVHVAKLTVPEDMPVFIQPHDVELLPFSSVDMEEYRAKYERKFKHSNFNQVQTHVFKHIYNSKDDVILLAPAGCGKTTCAELAILRNIRKFGPASKIGYIAANADSAALIANEWATFFGDQNQGLQLLTGNHHIDNPKVNRDGVNIVIGDPSAWNSLILTRSKKYSKSLEKFQLFIVDDIHLLYDDEDSHLEWVCSKIRIHTKFSKNPARIIALGSPTLAVDTIKNWLSFERGTSEPLVFNFSTSVRPVKLNLTVQTFNYHDQELRIVTMQRPVYRHILNESKMRPTMIFVPDFTKALELCECLLRYSRDDGTRFCETFATHGQLDDPDLAYYIKSGIGYIYLGMSYNDKCLVESLFEDEKIKILICTVKSCWSIKNRSFMTIIMDTQHNDGLESTDYKVTDIMQIIGLTGRPLSDHECKVIVLCQTSKANIHETILLDALPIESHHNTNLINIINYEISDKSIVNLNQIYTPYLALTFFYKRISINPNYYGIMLPEDSSKKSQTYHSYFNNLVNKIALELEKEEFIAIEGSHQNPNLSPSLLSKISLEYFICFETLAGYVNWLNETQEEIRTMDLIELIANYTFEMSFIAVRSGELSELRRLQKRHCPGYSHELHDARFKVKLLLLSIYGSDDDLAGELQLERQLVANLSHRLLMALLDIAWLKDSISLAKTALQVSKKICLFKTHPLPNIDLDVDVTREENIAKIQVNVTREGDQFLGDSNLSPTVHRDEGWFFIILAKTAADEEKFALFKRVKAPIKGNNTYSLNCELTYHSYDLYFMSDFYPSREDRRMKNFLTSE